MTVYKTSKRHRALHCHVGQHPPVPDCGCCALLDWTPAQAQQQQDDVIAHFPNVVLLESPTRTFNCHGYAYANRHGWFCDPEIFLSDDFREIDMNTAQPDDVLVYRDENNVITHSVIVNEALNGQIQTLRSKWGDNALVRHRPCEVKYEYGQPAQLFRRTRPLRRQVHR